MRTTYRMRATQQSLQHLSACTGNKATATVSASAESPFRFDVLLMTDDENMIRMFYVSYF